MKINILLIVFISISLSAYLHGQIVSQSEKFWNKLNPAFAEAEFVGDRETCISCHDVVTAAYDKTVHSRLFQHNINYKSITECESCHGPRSLHVEEPDNRFAISEEQYGVVCQQCHQGGEQMYWHNSMHKTAGVSCVSCHTIMEKRSNTALLAKTNQLSLCSTCHTDVSAKILRTSHHPIKEGNVDCSSCHNVHGSSSPAMLIKATSTETCNSCHQEKRGPFLWEHSPVRDDCMTCHEPHGSNNRSLLITQSASLCVSCHQYGGHINQYRYNRVSTPYGNGCVNCHTMVHGSNHPSGVKLTR